MATKQQVEIARLVDAVPEHLVTIPTTRGTQIHVGGEKLFALFEWVLANARPAPPDARDGAK